MEKKNLTIKDVPADDRDFLVNLANSRNITYTEAFTQLVNLSKNPVNQPENQKKTAELEAENQRLTAENIDFQRQIEAREFDLNEATEKLRVHSERITELETELTAYRNEPKGVVLSGFQFVCDLADQVAANLRKVRPFVKRDGIIPADTSEKVYPNAMVNIAVSDYLKRNYSHVTKP